MRGAIPSVPIRLQCVVLNSAYGKFTFILHGVKCINYTANVSRICLSEGCFTISIA